MRPNNFDFIRLVAAAQVAFVHILTHLQLEYLIPSWVSFFPGVPVFFFISGFLIAGSWDRNRSTSSFFLHRVLRIYPGLWVCFLVTLALIFSFSTSFLDTSLPNIIGWAAGQLSFIQFYNPSFLSGFGLGVVNGALWTITVELQFYLLVPLIMRFFADNAHRVIWLILVLFLVNSAFTELRIEFNEEIWLKLLQVSILPWLGFFLVGALAYRCFEIIGSFVRGKALVWLVVYLVVVEISRWLGLPSTGNSINPVQFVFLSIFVLSTAYSIPSFSDRVLRQQDISYGLYLYHSPLINVFVEQGFVGSLDYAVRVAILALGCAIASWFLVERTALRSKNYLVRKLKKRHESSVLNKL